jgi:glycosyltransferase involved in cell wall biosynthesis
MLWRQVWLWRFFKESDRLLDQRAYDFSYTRYSAAATPQLWLALRKESIPNVVEINTLGAQQQLLMLRLDTRIINLASVPVVISKVMEEWLREHAGDAVADRVRVVPNGVGSDRFRTLSDEDPNSPFRLAFAGLLKPKYGLKNVIRAAQSLPPDEICFHIFGAGPAEDRLSELSRNVPNFVMEGEIPFEEVPDHLSRMDALLYTTSPHFAYQSPTKLFEYMAVGRPIIAARTDQTEDILDHGRLGRLFEMESVNSLVAAVRDVRANYDTARKRAQEAQKVAKEKHKWESRVDRIIQMVEK